MKGPNVTSTCPPFTSDQIKFPFLTKTFKLRSIQLRTWKYAAHSTKFAKPPPSLIFIWKFNTTSRSKFIYQSNLTFVRLRRQHFINLKNLLQVGSSIRFTFWRRTT
ncbi:MAG: hypothetical protein ACTS6A_02395 [Candidatus Hodgkinia cicadicola]